jgi:cyanophycinase
MSAMRTSLALVSALGLWSCTALGPARPDPFERLELVIVGGGTTLESIQQRALELARGRESRVVVLPQASDRPDRGEASAEMWREAGAAEVTNLSDLSDIVRARAVLESADLIWMGGGDQTLLMAALRESGLDEVVRTRAAAGVTCGGTSAGAAVMTLVMITGEGDGLEKVAAGATHTATGLGLLPAGIVDQHFLARQRANRLLGAVLDHPELIGFGIDERTALVVTGGRAEVAGEGQVVVIDAREAAVERTEPGALAAARGLRVQVLRPGMAYELGR